MAEGVYKPVGYASDSEAGISRDLDADVSGGIETWASRDKLLPKSKSREMKEELDKVFQFQYQTHVGHKGEALCIDGSDGMDWILSGGEDGTARLWQYSEEGYQCYRLARFWKHTDPKPAKVTSVAFAGDEGPVITGTNLGHVFVMGVASSHMCGHHQSDLPISDLRVKREEYKDEGTWLLVIATGNMAYLTETKPTHKGRHHSAVAHTCKDIANFTHSNPVTTVMHMPGSIEEGAAVATCSGHTIRLWSLSGTLLYRLKEPDQQDITCFT